MKNFLLFVFIFLVLPILCFAEQIDINSATLSQLDIIVHVGEKTAQKIIDARPYDSVQDLSRVKGIGNEKYLQDIINQGFACVNCISPANAGDVGLPVGSPTSGEATSSSVEVESPPTFPSGVVINEILPSPEGADDQNEWIVSTIQQIALAYS